MSLNEERGQYRLTNAKSIALLREQGGWLARQHHTGRAPLFPGRSLVQVWLAFPDRIDRDTANWYPTIKAMVDGFTDGCLWPDDKDKHVIGPHLWPADRLSAKRVVEMRYVITEIDPRPEF